jgi:ankyrin repeat protein
MPITAFMQACRDGNTEAVRSMLQQDPSLAGARVEGGETAVIAALYRGHREVVDVLLAAGAPVDLFTAAAVGLPEIVQARLGEQPAGIGALSFDGWTALHLAAFFGHVDVIDRLLAAGADVNARSRNSTANTPLHAAVAGGRVAAALRLIGTGADVHAVDSGKYTPLHIAAESGQVPVVESLLARGADPHAVDNDDKTPLSRAAAKNHAAIVDLITVRE